MASAATAAASTKRGGAAGSKPRYSVLLPTYKEEENLPIIFYLLTNVFREHDIDYQIVIIDDSPVGDPTYEVAKKLQTLYGKDRVEILKRTQKLGLASAYMTGIDLADGDFVIILDADMSHHPKFIPDMIAKQKEGDYDVVSGTRYRYGGGIYGWSMFRKLTSRVANFLATTLLSPNASDLTGSFRLYKREVLQSIRSSIISQGYTFQMEVIVRCRALGYSVAEVPITFVDRVIGESKMGPGEISNYLKGLWAIFMDL